MKHRLLIFTLPILVLLVGCEAFEGLARLCRLGTYTVTSNAVGDGFALCEISGDCDSLRTAIYTANACGAGGEPQVIRLPQEAIYSVSDKMTDVETRVNPLAKLQREEERVGPTGLPLIEVTITVEGGGATIQKAERAPNLRFFHVLEGASLTLASVTLKGGGLTNGGAVYNEGMLNLRAAELDENSAGQNGGYGGAIYNAGTLVIGQDSLFTENIAEEGAAIYNAVSAEVSDTTFSENGAPAANSSIFHNAREANSELNRVTFIKNSSEEGTIFNFGTLTLSQSTFTENQSINAPSVYSLVGRVLIRRSTFHNELGRFVAAISCQGSAETIILEDVTIFGNRTESELGSAAIRDGDDCIFEISNSIIAGTSSRDCLLANPPTIRGSNLSSDDTCDGFSTVARPDLGPLQDNGGPTQTLFPNASSPAVDAGGISCLSEDQRGEPRPVDGNDDGTAACDIGAVERGS